MHCGLHASFSSLVNRAPCSSLNRLLASVGEVKHAADNFSEHHLPVTQDAHHVLCIEDLSFQVLVDIGIRERSLHVSTELLAQLPEFINEQGGVLVFGNVPYLLVLIHTFRVVVFTVGLAGARIFLAALHRKEGSHHTDTAKLVFQVHDIYLVTECSKVHTRRST